MSGNKFSLGLREKERKILGVCLFHPTLEVLERH